jgi:phosphotriesterase-related protein
LPHEHVLGQPPPEFAKDDLLMDSRPAALDELYRFYAAGGRALVEMTTPDYARDAAGMLWLAQHSGVHLVAAAGFNKEKFSAAFLDAPVEALAERFIGEIERGMDGTVVRAGLVKAASTLNEISPRAEKMFHAAAQAHLATGAPVSTHTEAGTMALEQIDLLTGDGVDAAHIVIGHLDRKLEWEYHLEIARRGVYLGFDQIGKEQYAPDALRVEFIVRLVQAGFGKQILLAGDMARRSYWKSYGDRHAPGLTYIPERFVPRLRQAGLSPAHIADLTVHNPARAFSFS